MILNYHWEDVTVNVPYHPYGSDWIDQHTRPCVQDVDYDYEVEINEQDILDYLFKSKKDQAFGRKVLEFLSSCNAIEYEEIENNGDFVAFLLKRYEDDAWEEFQDGNEAY